MKKLAMLLAVLMLAVAAFSVSAFEDVTVEDACFDAVNTLTSLNVIKGKTETTFAPEEPVTREQMAMLFTRLYTTVNFENGANMTPFNDLDDPYYNSVIAWCYDAKVINGTTPTTFEPKAHIIYQDALTMACRLLGYTDLTYPLGNITKARLIGLTDGLEGVAYDKELTRGEVAIILYNALEAEGAEIIKENKVKYYNGYPILEAVERNFEIAVDVYNFKKETYQIVGTDNFHLDGFAEATTDTSYVLAKVDTDTYEYAEFDNNKLPVSEEFEFEDIAVAEDTVSDDNILAYIEVLYRGESLKDKKAVVLSSVINSNLEDDAEIGIYFKKEANKKKAEAQKTKILVDGKVYDITKDKMVYAIDADGKITNVADLSTQAVFWQTEENEQGMYAQKVIDVNKDNVPDYIMFFPMSFEKVKAISTKGVYTLETSGKFETEEEDCKLVINAEEVEKNDYVLTYNYGKYTVIDTVVEPVVTTVSSYTGTSGNYKFALATGDVVTFAKANNPVKGEYKAWANNDILEPSNKEVALYVINDKVVYTTDATTAGYDAFDYAFFIHDGDTETSVDVEDGSVEVVKTIIVNMDGKAVSIPVHKDSSIYKVTGDNKVEISITTPGMITIKDIKDGKYIIDENVITDAKNTYDKDTKEGYEKHFANGAAKIWYDTNSKIYKLSAEGQTYIVDLTADTKLYAAYYEKNQYDTVKCFTMANFPQLSSTVLNDAIIAAVKDGENNVTAWNLLVGYIADASNVGDSDEYTDYRIVLSSGAAVNNKNEQYLVYEVLNPVTGAVETLTATQGDVKNPLAAGNLVRKQTSGKVEAVVGINEAFDGTDSVDDGYYTKKLMQLNTLISNDTLITVYKGKNQEALGESTKGQEIKVSGVKVVVLDIDDEDKITVDVTEDLSVLEGKVVRTYVSSGLSYKPAYMVVIPYEWAKAAGFTNLEAYDEYEELA